METEKLQINLPEGVAEITIREGAAVKVLDPKAPIKVNLSGIIGVPFEFLSKRISESNQIDQKRCHIIVDREKVLITLVTSEDNEYQTGRVVGKLEIHPKFKEFGINQAKAWEPKQLGDFFRMNKVFFPDKQENAKLVTDLKNFKAKVNANMEKSKQDNGSMNVSYSQVVDSNLPGSFKASIPVFKGMGNFELEVEVLADVNGMDVSLMLICPAAVQLLEELRNQVIDEQIAKFRELAPEIAIIEQ